MEINKALGIVIVGFGLLVIGAKAASAFRLYRNLPSRRSATPWLNVVMCIL